MSKKRDYSVKSTPKQCKKTNKKKDNGSWTDGQHRCQCGRKVNVTFQSFLDILNLYNLQIDVIMDQTLFWALQKH